MASAGQEPPEVSVAPPGPQSRTWLTRGAHYAAPMGAAPVPKPAGGSPALAGIVLARGLGSNLFDVDGNRYVDLAAGFGAVLLGHAHPRLNKVLALQSERLLQGLGDVYPSEPKVALLERLARLHPESGAQVILGQSGADAVSSALKTAVLFTGKPGIIAFRGAYHGLSYGPLAALDLRSSYRDPFTAQLNPHVTFLEYPSNEGAGGGVLSELEQALRSGQVGAVLIEPILGRGGVVVPPDGFLQKLGETAKSFGALFIADEIWTGLGRSGSWLRAVAEGAKPDLVCLGKGLGGGLPVSACIGRREVMGAWQSDREVVHTSTFAGAPLACATAIALLETLERERLVERAAEVGRSWRQELSQRLEGLPQVREVRGQGLMVGIELVDASARARLAHALLRQGYVVTAGGGARETLVLTPALTISETLLTDFASVLAAEVRGLGIP